MNVAGTLRLGLRANAAQFILLVAVNALVGGLLGSERTVLPLLAEHDFHLAAYTAALTYILAFGATKAVTNFVAGTLSDRYGRKPVLLAGWLVGIPVPLLIIWAPSWGWIVAANVLLGVNQGLAWSTTVIMKIDLAGPRRRGLAMGLNEAAGYLALAGTAAATGALAAHYGLRPAPFLLALAYAAIGLGLSTFLVKETRGHAHQEAITATNGVHAADLPTRQVAALVSYREPALSSAAQAGMVNNLNDGLAWGLFPLLFATAGLPLGQIGALAALYPAVWGLGQLATGPLSDRYGRKPFIVTGMLLQAAALAWTAAADTFAAWALAAVLLGAGTALVYPTLLAAIGDVAHPTWRARAVGVYRLWRDGGFAIGALLAGILADAYGIRTATYAVAALTATSGLYAWARMYEIPLEHQYVLYAAATHSTLLELLTHWQAWVPDMDWSDLSREVPVLADAIAALVSQGLVELFYGPPGGELGLVSPADVPSVVHDPGNWWAEERVPWTGLLLTPEAGLVGVPEPRTSSASG